MTESSRNTDCYKVIDQLIKLLHISYDELMIFERAFGDTQENMSKSISEVIKGEIECQKGLLKILIYISELIRQQDR